MKLHEYQARDILARQGIPVTGGGVATTPDDVRRIGRSELGTAGPPAWHTHLAQGVGPDAAVEPGKELQGIIPGVDDQRQAVEAGQRLGIGPAGR